MRRAIVLAMLVGCVGPVDDTGEPPVDDAFPAFALGVEYTQPGLAEPHVDTGVTWAKTRLEAFEWRQSEPAAPVGGVHTYDWSCPDAHVLDYQRAGITHLQSYLSPRSPWGSVDAAGVTPADIMVAPAHEEDLRAWLRALFERYDGDGLDDAPGLLAPVRHWVVGPEWTGFWPSGDADDYIAFAEIVRAEATAVYPDVVLGSMPLLFADEFAGNEPSTAEIAERMGAPYVLRNDNTGVTAMLDRPDLFDYYDVHALGDYTEVPPLVAWMRAEMDARGYDRPLWFDDAFPAGFLANGAGFPSNYPVTAASYGDVYAVLRAHARGQTTGGFAPAASTAWIEGYLAASTVKKVATARGEGVSGIMLGNTEDWMVDAGGSVRDATVFLIGASAAMGMIDVDHPGGYDLCDARSPGDRRPAWYALQLVAGALGDGVFDEVERIGATEGPRGYRFERDGASTWILWSEDGALHLPGEPAQVPDDHVLTLPSGVTSVRVTPTPVARGEEPVADVRDATGTITLSLDWRPVIVTVE